jgi:hypothetical protein
LEKRLSKVTADPAMRHDNDHSQACQNETPTESISTRINKDEMPAAPPMIKWWAASKLRTDREIGCLSPTTKK